MRCRRVDKSSGTVMPNGNAKRGEKKIRYPQGVC